MTDDVSLVWEYTTRLVTTARALDDAAAPSLCEGWTRGHVLTHVARNAEAVGRLAHWAATGEPQRMYPGGTQARDADIAAGAGRPPGELAQDLVSSAEALAPQLAALSGPLSTERVEMRGGLEVDARTLPFLRLRELVFHHVDLDAGFIFEDVDDDLLRRFIDDAVARLGKHPDAPPLELRDGAGGAWSLTRGSGDGATVEGGPAGLLLWLARRDPRGVHAEGPLPDLPRGA